MEKLYSIYYYNIQQNICERKETKEKTQTQKKLQKIFKKTWKNKTHNFKLPTINLKKTKQNKKLNSN